MAITRSAGIAGLAGVAVLVAACGRISDKSPDGPTGDYPEYRTAEVPYAVSGTESELDLGNPDAVLAAALAAATSAAAVATRSLGALDTGASPPGRGTIVCGAGSQNEAIAVDSGSGQRSITLSSNQCFGAGSGSNQNGVVQLAYLRPSANQAMGTLAFGTGTTSFVISVPQLGGGEYNFRQSRGSVAFDGEFDGSPSTSMVNGFSLVIGRGALSGSPLALSPNRQVEVLLGAPGIDYSVALTTAVTTGSYSPNGRLFLRGSGANLTPACNFAASVDVATNAGSALQINIGDGTVVGGLLTLSTSAGSATVSFDAAGAAVVTPTSGVPQSYTAAIVGNFCGVF